MPLLKPEETDRRRRRRRSTAAFKVIMSGRVPACIVFVGGGLAEGFNVLAHFSGVYREPANFAVRHLSRLKVEQLYMYQVGCC